MSYLHRFSDERSPHPRLGGQAGPADQAGNARPATIPRRMRLLMWVGLALALTAGAAWLGHSLALRTALDQLHADAQKRLDVIAARLDGELARFDYLPSLLETTPEVFELLAAPDDTGLRQRVSRHLRGITATAGADNLYVTNRAGLTVAAADAGQPGRRWAPTSRSGPMCATRWRTAAGASSASASPPAAPATTWPTRCSRGERSAAWPPSR